MAHPLRRLILAPELVKLRMELWRLTRLSEAHQPIEAHDGDSKCRVCGEPDPCPTQVSVDGALVRLLDDFRRVGRKALS